MNYYIQDFCCLCLSNSSEKCNKNFSKYPDNLTLLNKIQTVFLGLSAVMDSDCRICKKCGGIIDFIYEFNKTCWKNIYLMNSYKKVLKENQLKEQCDIFVILNKSKKFNENTLTPEEVKIEPPESSLSIDDTLCNTDFASESTSEGAAEIKEEILLNYETSGGISETSWLDSEVKIEIEETDLKKECMREEEFVKSNIQDLVNNSVGLIEEVFDEEEGNADLLKDPLPEVAEGESGETRGRRESIGEIHSEHFQENFSEEVEEEFDCAESDKSASCESEIDSDISIHSKKQIRTRENTHKCDICGKLFGQKIYLKRHMLTHTGEKPHKCDICGKLFSLKSYLKTHMMTHTGEKPHKCDICGKLLTQKRNLNKHYLIHTGEKPHKCDICGKLFRHKTSFKSHMLIHTGERPHKCDICGKLFSLKRDLNRHYLIHTGEKPHKCNICGTSFNRTGSLKSHMLTHTGEKPHKCDICGKLFTQKGSLKTHMLTHTGEKPHKCDMCGKLFSLKSHLKTHMLTHTGEKHHKCDICGKIFTLKRDLNGHYFIHTGEKPQKCNICETSFIRTENLKLHMLTHTDEKNLIKVPFVENYFAERKTLKDTYQHTLVKNS